MGPMPRWAYVTDRAPKPFVHPVHAPGGRVLTVESPPDHAWHRGLWFAIKFVDGDNFWEEQEPYGSQHEVDAGVLEWRRPDGSIALREERLVRPVDIDIDETAYGIEWQSVLTAPGDGAVLDRTPYTTWGGYGGLAFRGSPDWEDTRLLVADGSEHRRAIAVPSPWCDLSGPDAGITFLDHPSNPRHPVPWYGASRSRVYGEGWSNFLNAAFLFHEPWSLEPDAPLRLRYRVVVHDGRWDVDRAQAAWDAWVSA